MTEFNIGDGKDFHVFNVQGDTMEVSVQCNESAMFFWALQYGPYVEVMEPEELRAKIGEAVGKMCMKYEMEESR